MQSNNSKIFLHTELILPQEILQLQGSSRADHYKASSRDGSLYIQAFYMAEQDSPGSSLRLPVCSSPCFQLILPSRNSILSSSQHPHSPYSNSQAHSYRILPGEIGFIPKGQVLYIYAILRSVCSNLLILVLRIILQEY